MHSRNMDGDIWCTMRHKYTQRQTDRQTDLLTYSSSHTERDKETNQQSAKKRHINYNWSLENWVWFECSCSTRDKIQLKMGSNTSKKPLSNLCSYIFWCSWACKQRETMPGTQLNCLWFLAACLHFISLCAGKKKADKSVHRPRPNLRMFHWSYKNKSYAPE